ncbi:MAG: sulfotransferase family 2 domain-containing protein [Bacteroidetes bacterium]|nr:sulfotransferase family 2 domain-containing protein [Bacteroidota bacterium]
MKLIFLHIPKAGGTTFHTILERFYDKEEIFDIRVVEQELRTQEFLDLNMEQKQKINLLKGHLTFGLHEQFKTSDVKYITFFRNPVDRIISHYDFVIRRPKHYLYNKVVGEKMSLL